MASLEIGNHPHPQKRPLRLGQNSTLRSIGNKPKSGTDLLASLLRQVLEGLLADVMGGVLPGGGGGLLGGLQAALRPGVRDGE